MLLLRAGLTSPEKQKLQQQDVLFRHVAKLLGLENGTEKPFSSCSASLLSERHIFSHLLLETTQTAKERFSPSSCWSRPQPMHTPDPRESLGSCGMRDLVCGPSAEQGIFTLDSRIGCGAAWGRQMQVQTRQVLTQLNTHIC